MRSSSAATPLSLSRSGRCCSTVVRRTDDLKRRGTRTAEVRVSFASSGAGNRSSVRFQTFDGQGILQRLRSSPIRKRRSRSEDGMPETNTKTAIARLHHNAFVTRDQEATRRFYEDLIGL